MPQITTSISDKSNHITKSEVKMYSEAMYVIKSSITLQNALKWVQENDSGIKLT
jgi:hypothetical protein